MLSRKKILLIVILFLALAVRLFLAFNTPNLTYESYYHLRHTENIMENFLPSFEDDLSYGGRYLKFLPFFHYFSAALMFIIPLSNEIAAKIINNLLFVLIGLVVYFTAKRITKNENAALFSTLIAVLLPVSYLTNYFGPLPLTLLLFFLSMFFFINFNSISKRKEMYWFLITLFLLFLTSSLAGLLILGILFYVLLSKIEEKRLGTGDLELGISSLLFFLWWEFIFFKETLLSSGISFIWQNIPSQLISQYYPEFNIIQTLILVGFIPFIAGLYLIYNSLFKERNRSILLIICVAIINGILAWFELIPFLTTMSFLGIILAILFAPFYQSLLEFYNKTKVSNIEVKAKKIKKFVKFNNYLNLTLSIVLIISLLIPAVMFAYGQEIPSSAEVETFQWLKENSAEGSVIFGNVEEGNLISYYSERKNIMDLEFGMVEDVEQRVEDLKSLYITNFQTLAIGIANDYSVDYLVLTNSAREEYDIDNFNYLSAGCFELLYNNEENKVYKSKCTLS
ncbi:hypothetical protein HN385_00960 [archaeon]|jgi:hypothetical protein|nr:hypothetical protein [archaeon]MBT3450622.1 hypothetical protein [archaeon]MBT6868692.1 hypothetical protein [archaeon]MBT7193480.1 hypothetical protein [archaeon]MBT7381071.1 hypothetical protein [archaeon]